MGMVFIGFSLLFIISDIFLCVFLKRNKTKKSIATKKYEISCIDYLKVRDRRDIDGKVSSHISPHGASSNIALITLPAQSRLL